MKNVIQKSKCAALGLAVAVSGAAFAQTAHAGTTTLDYEVAGNPYGSQNWSASVDYIYNGSAVSSNGGLFSLTNEFSQSIMAFCIDLDQFLADGVTYDDMAPVAGITAAEMTNIDRLFTSSYADVTDGNSAAGFQIALWEIITDSDLDLTDGNFETTGAGAQYDFATAALAGLGASTGGYNLTTYATTTNQDLIGASAVPLPASALLLMSGLFGAGALRKRRKA